MSFNIDTWLRQPTTVLGLGTLSGVVAAAMVHYATGGSTTLAIGTGSIAFAAVHLVVNDNSAAPNTVETLVADAVTAIVSKNLTTALPGLLKDGVAVVASLQPEAVAVAATAPAVPVSASSGAAARAS